jgi:hypothetical protein
MAKKAGKKHTAKRRAGKTRTKTKTAAVSTLSEPTVPTTPEAPPPARVHHLFTVDPSTTVIDAPELFPPATVHALTADPLTVGLKGGFEERHQLIAAHEAEARHHAAEAARLRGGQRGLTGKKQCRVADVINEEFPDGIPADFTTPMLKVRIRRRLVDQPVSDDTIEDVLKTFGR